MTGTRTEPSFFDKKDQEFQSLQDQIGSTLNTSTDAQTPTLQAFLAYSPGSSPLDDDLADGEEAHATQVLREKFAIDTFKFGSNEVGGLTLEEVEGSHPSHSGSKSSSLGLSELEEEKKSPRSRCTLKFRSESKTKVGENARRQTFCVDSHANVMEKVYKMCSSEITSRRLQDGQRLGESSTSRTRQIDNGEETPTSLLFESSIRSTATGESTQAGRANNLEDHGKLKRLSSRDGVERFTTLQSLMSIQTQKSDSGESSPHRRASSPGRIPQIKVSRQIQECGEGSDQKSSFKPIGHISGAETERESQCLHHYMVSCKESINNSEFVNFKENRRLMERSEINFNILVIGETGMGKTTFIEQFLSLKFKREQKGAIRPHTSGIHGHKGTLEDEDFQVNFEFYDTPGYGKFTDMDQWQTDIIQFVASKYDNHKTQKKARTLEELETDSMMHSLSDGRIHLCLYFMNGPRVKQVDLQMMSKLHKLVNIIPIISKCDSLTKSEILELKTQILLEASDQKIQLFDPSSCISYKDIRNRLQFGALGSCPPFAIVSHTRKYTWGTCQKDDPQHSEFQLLYKMLVGHFSLACIKETKRKYKRYLAVGCPESNVRDDDGGVGGEGRRKFLQGVLYGGAIGTIGVGVLFTGFLKSLR
eukprot:CAMPEP_0114982658 /NCGR_PEP_ID=MMETSP0216-20121206/6250_1 /TAXON_ID=223996 /ORGANISM="Protocruzia adherens, Strain Boccale" /LENGTH=646 /DNA_ID=CAMNT_0002344521 /DNA_START=368 /DNA_END=2308 /DNA_ORIENTATION=+